MELRFSNSELRAEGSRYLKGIAAPFGVRAKIGGNYEEIDPHAFDSSLRAKDDIRALFNHSANHVLGRTSAGTLKLETRDDGLHFEVDLPDTSIGHDIYSLVERGDLREMSFAFECRKDDWRDIQVNGQKVQLRTLRDVLLHDVSVVTYPAYAQGTSVSARSIYGGKRRRPMSVGTYSGAGYDAERERLKFMVRLAMHI